MAYSSNLRSICCGVLLAALAGALTPVSAAPAGAAPAPVSIQGVPINSWGYWLINDDPSLIAESPYDVMVMDFQRDPSAGGPFKPSELAQMKKKPDGSRRFVISYISIGEAENYRYYWAQRTWADVRNRTPLVEKENPEWPGNLAVKYWQREWQNLVLADADSYINRIMDAGFDGVYLDKIDNVEYFKDKTPPGTHSDDLMIEFVRRISMIAKARNPNFLIIAQNAEGLLIDDDYRSFIDGIGKESLLFDEGTFDADLPCKPAKRNDASDIADSNRLLSKLRADGKLVMVVEYLCHGKQMTKAEQDKIDAQSAQASGELAALGFVPYFGPRDLARLNYPELKKTAAELAAEAGKQK